MDNTERNTGISLTRADPASGSRFAGVISLGQALRYWLKLGFISFGGPAGQIALMHRDLVDDKRWISEKRFLHALNYCMLLPGPEAQQLATYMGWLMHRTWGGILAGALFVLPSLFILIALSWVYMAYGHTTLVAGLFFGIKPAVVALVVQAVVRIGSRTLSNAWLWSIAVASFVAMFVLHVPFPAIVAVAGALGWLRGRLAPSAFGSGSGSGSAHQASKAKPSHAPALIDDDTPLAEHTRFRWTRFAWVVATGLLLWAAPMGLLAWALGATHPYTLMAGFFTKAALLTFGGAYAVLPYVYQGAVVSHGWLTPTQMMDGLALGETTPGPLIMVVSFVAFVGGYVLQPLEGASALMGGVVAALIVTWFTFLPSFIFILAGAPLVESTRHDIKFTAPLAAITAAVVGVVLNLALFFAWHTWWPAGWEGGVAAVPVALSVMAGLALIRFKRSPMEVIAACALMGLAVHAFVA
ncbi:chromate efflux transporter [Hydrogenophaga sp. 5NK40-0174]|uniref:chromate efflux transporter n=1 Tax=Hydrogenophaga sp. 5NK40-0174 TaxID=3127649 RepID=UPI003102A5F4